MTPFKNWTIAGDIEDEILVNDRRLCGITQVIMILQQGVNFFEAMQKESHYTLHLVLCTRAINDRITARAMDAAAAEGNSGAT